MKDVLMLLFAAIVTILISRLFENQKRIVGLVKYTRFRQDFLRSEILELEQCNYSADPVGFKYNNNG